MKWLLCIIGLLPSALRAQAPAAGPPANQEIALSRDSVRQFFGTYEFEPQFRMRIFSENTRLYAQRLGDVDKFEIFPKQANVFFLKAMPAELEFRRGATGGYETLLLHQGGQAKQARRIQAQPVELYDTVRQLDSLLYGAYNQRNLPALLAFFSPKLEFYHDQTGCTDYAGNRARFRENFAKPGTLRRELRPGSLEVYPIRDFGAIELGVHRFYQAAPGQPEKLVSEPKFLHVWQRTGGKWQIIRVVSYDH